MRTHDHDQLKAAMDEVAATGGTTLAEAPWRGPTAAYHDPAHLAREQELFASAPLVAASASELAGPTSYLARDVAGTPLLLARPAEGPPRAFLNACRHRGSQLVAEGEAGCARRFTCPFHAWTYGLDGQLLGVTSRVGFPDLDRDAHGLVELPCEERHGLLWVGLRPGAPLEVAAHLGALDDDLGAMELGRFVVERSVELHPEMNWKLVVDGFLETYHIRFLHPTTLSPHMPSDQAAFHAFGPHGRMTALRNHYDGARQATPADFLRQVLVVYQLFPNTVLVWLTDHFELWQVEPWGGRADRCRVRASLLVRPEELGRTAAWDKNLQILEDTVFGEDWVAAASAQRSLSAPAAPRHVVYGRNEPALQHFHRQLAAAVG